MDLRAVADIRPGEWRRTLLMAANLFLLVASHTIVKAVRDALFLVHFGLQSLSLVMIGLAIFAGGATAAFVRLWGGWTRRNQLAGMSMVIAVSLVVIWGLLRARVFGMPPLLYVWSSFFGIFVVTNFWLLANDLFDARAARRIFAVLGAGAILGGVIGGKLVEILAPRLGPVHLLLVAACGFAAAAICTLAAWEARPAVVHTAGASESSGTIAVGHGVRLLRKHRYLRLIALLVLLSTIATTVIDLQVKSLAKSSYGADAAAMAAYFGRLAFLLSVLSLVLQLVLTTRFLSRLGVGAALFALPFAIVAGSGAILGHVLAGVTGLGMASFAKVGDGGLRFSLDKASMELLYLPVPAGVKGNAKPFIDTFVDKLATGASGLLWLTLAAIAGGGVAGRERTVGYAAVALLVVVAAWCVTIVRTRREYVRAFHVSLGGAATRAPRVLFDLGPAAQPAAVQRALASADARVVRLALDGLGERLVEPEVAVAFLKLVDHADAGVRARAFDALASAGDDRGALRARRAIGDVDDEVRAAAARYLACSTLHGADELVEHADPRVRLAALAHVAEHGPREAAWVAARLEELAAAPLAHDASVRREIARAVGSLGRLNGRSLLETLLHDEDPSVAYAAGRSAARLGVLSHSRTLIRALGRSPASRPSGPSAPRSAVTAAAALRGLGQSISPLLAAALVDESLPAAARGALPALILDLAGSDGITILLTPYPRLSTRLRSRIAHALAAATTVSTPDAGTAPLIARAILAETRACARWAGALAAERSQDGPECPGSALLKRTLGEAFRAGRDRILELAGLSHPQRDLRAARRALAGDDPIRRANALELLELTLPAPLGRELGALLDGDPPPPADRVAVLASLAIDPDPWLRACALHVAGESGLDRLASLVDEAAAHDPIAYVRETAGAARRNLHPLGVTSDAHDH